MPRLVPTLVAVAGSLAASLALSACFYRPVQVAPALAPVDATRPMVRYKPIQGQACTSMILHAIPAGNNSLNEALWRMKRLTNVDGYVEVTVEKKVVVWLLGHTKCTVVTAYPFTYGTEPRPLAVRAPTAAPRPVSAEGVSQGREEPEVSEAPRAEPPPPAAEAPPAEAAPAGPDPAEIEASCGRFGELAGATDLIRRVVTSRCVERASAGDADYLACVRGARSAEDVKRCNALPAAGE